MFVTKKKYNKLKDEMRVLKSDILFRKQISMIKDKRIEELKKELERVNKQLEDIYENSFDYDELMILLHEEYTALQCSQIIDNFNHNMRG